MVALALLGGSFDPIHIGHLYLADSVIAAGIAPKVIFVPASRSPHKAEAASASAEDRLEMVRLAIEDDPRFSSSDIELARTPPSYSIDTVRYFMQEFGLQPRELALIVGSDLLSRLSEWSEFEELCRLVIWAVVNRVSGADNGRNLTVKQTLSGMAEEYPVFRPIHVDNPVLAVSSSALRNSIRQRGPYRYLVAPKVYEFIESRRLYSTIRNG